MTLSKAQIGSQGKNKTLTYLWKVKWKREIAS